MTIADTTALVSGANRFGTYGVTQAFLPLVTRFRGAIANGL